MSAFWLAFLGEKAQILHTWPGRSRYKGLIKPHQFNTSNIVGVAEVSTPWTQDISKNGRESHPEEYRKNTCYYKALFPLWLTLGDFSIFFMFNPYAV